MMNMRNKGSKLFSFKSKKKLQISEFILQLNTMALVVFMTEIHTIGLY